MINGKLIVGGRIRIILSFMIIFSAVPFFNSYAGTSVFKDLGDDFVYLFTQKDFYLTVGGLGAIPYVFKKPIDREDPELNEWWSSSRTADRFFESGEWLGNGAVPYAASILILSLKSGPKDARLKAFGSDLLRAEIINNFVTLSMKLAINRTRPDGDPYSYPSGHTSTAFTAAGVINYHFGPGYGIPAYLLATYVGLSRLQENKHYLSDVMVGAALGYYLSNKIVHRAGSSDRISLYPASIDSSPALGLTFAF